MFVIALDTATPAVTSGLVALDGDAPRCLAERITINPRAHGERLMPQLLEASADAGHALATADAIVVGTGPGPFTGLRVGMVTAAALGQALNVPVYPVCGLDAIAVTVDGPVVVATDARRNEVYWAAYDGDHQRVDGPHVQRAAEVPLAELGIGTVAGEKASALAEASAAEAVAHWYPTPVGLVQVVQRELWTGATPDPLVPMYLRRPDAAEPGPRKHVTPSRGAS